MQREAGVKSDCETCPLKKLRETFKSYCRKFLNERLEKDSPDDLDTIIENVSLIANLSNSVDGVGDDWTFQTAQLVGVWRHEKYIAECEDDYNNRDK